MMLSIFCRQSLSWTTLGIHYVTSDILRPVYLFWNYNLIILVAQAGYIHTYGASLSLGLP